MRNRLSTLRNRGVDLLGGAPFDTAVASAGKLKDEIGTLDAEREALKARRRELPTHVTFTELGERGGLDALPSGERLLLDIVRMTACSAETRMMPAVAEAQGRKTRLRCPLTELFQSDADNIPESESGEDEQPSV